MSIPSRVTLGALLLLAFALRVGLPYGTVLGGDYVAFLETDAWYHMRLVDSLVRHFPDRLWFDAYLQHPDGEDVVVGPLFDWLIAGAALVFGGGSPSERLVDVVGAFAPAVLGALTTLPVYVIGRALFSPAAGAFAALLFATLPGGSLKRSLLGYTDHHCGEMLFSSLVLMALVLSLAPNASPFWRRYGGVVAGLALGACLLTWSGAVILVVILAGWAAAQIVLERLMSRAGSGVAGVAGAMLGVALVALAPWAKTTRYFGYQAIALALGLAGVAGLRWLARATEGRRHGMAAFVAAPVGVTVLAVAVLVLEPWQALALVPDLARLSPFRTTYVAEATPLMMSPLWHPLPFWDEFTTSTFLAVGALAIVGTEVVARPVPGRVLLLWWTLAMLAATVAQVRFTYYLGIPVAVLSGAACGWVLAWAGSLGRPVTVDRQATHAARWVSAAVTCVLAVVTVGPSVPRLQAYAQLPPNPGSDWVDTLRWMRFNTEEPFGDPAAYYRTNVAPPAAYGVLAWWDFGYWIIRLAHRVPLANPRQSGVGDVAAFLLAEDEASALQMLERTRARYVVVDALLQLVHVEGSSDVLGFFTNVVTATGGDRLKYGQVFFRRRGDVLEPVLTYTPEYYRTMMSRLYAFEGKATEPRGPVSVITTQTDTIDGRQYEVIVDEERFPTYDDAQAALGGERSGRQRIVGWHPWETCVPLEEVTALRVVYRSLGRERRADGTAGPPLVQVFEYQPGESESPVVDRSTRQRLNRRVTSRISR